MQLFILNKDFEIMGMLDSYSSIEWVERYNETGDFVLSTIATTDSEKNEMVSTVELLYDGYWIAREDSDMIVQIEKRIKDTSEEKGNDITVSGRSIEKILGQRIIWNQTNTKAGETVEDFVRRLINENAINPTNAKRKIPGLVLGARKGFTETFEKQITGDNLLTAIIEICQAYEYGFKITMTEEEKLAFELYKGEDRSYNQTKNSYVIFSDSFDNIANTSYEYDKTNYSNVALIGGEGEGIERKYQTIGESEGFERYELFVDAKDISSNSGEVSATEYNKMLIEKGMEKLAENAITELFEGEIENTNTYIYKKDYFVGDIVQIEDETGRQASTRIIGMIESDNENGHRIVPTYGTWEVQNGDTWRIL